MYRQSSPWVDSVEDAPPPIVQPLTAIPLQPIPSRTCTSVNSRPTSPPPSSPATPKPTSRSSRSPRLPLHPRRPTLPVSSPPTRARRLRLRARPPLVRPPPSRRAGSRRRRTRLPPPTRHLLLFFWQGLGKYEGTVVHQLVWPPLGSCL